MGYYEDVYSSPENYGLKLVGEIEWSDESYSFDITALWYHEESKTLYVGSDVGCSCPSPFEDVRDLDGLTKITKSIELIDYLKEHGNDEKVGEIGELIVKARQYL